MGIRTYKKDHLKELAPHLVAAPLTIEAGEQKSDDPLRFWTHHPKKPIIVDLNLFKNGEQRRSKSGGSYSGGFSGRPGLIAQLAPVLRNLMLDKEPNSVTQHIYAFRSWWRLFDAVESSISGGVTVAARVENVSDITELHRQRAFDDGMDRLPFSNFLRIINIVRKENRLPQLHWIPPERPDPKRYQPPAWQIRKIRLALKNGWREASSRWKRAEEMLAGATPQTAEEARLLRNYQRFRSAVERTNQPRPPAADLYGDMLHGSFSAAGYNVPDMVRGFYPDALDIRMAFHQCLANTGWNPSTLLSLDINENFIEPHPKDPLRYLMRGHKGRGTSEQLTDGLYRHKASAGMILDALIKRTEPLRVQLRKNLTTLKEEMKILQAECAAPSFIDYKQMQIVILEQGVRSPWLYLSTGKSAITWLDRDSYHRGLVRNRDGNFLGELIEVINQKQPPDKQLSNMNPSDFRDAFTTNVFDSSGGDVRWTMRMLGHKNPATTGDYCDNNLLNDESHRLYRSFSTALWHEIETRGQVDPSIIAMFSRAGVVTEEERRRLDEYRSLKRSRLNVGCKNPTQPPKHIDPNFESDGKSMCAIQRCTLCIDHAVIFPESLSGLCKRLAELRHLQMQMSVEAFLASSFGKEMENTELVLRHFDSQQVQSVLADWQQRITDNKHRIITFEGVQKV